MNAGVGFGAGGHYGFGPGMGGGINYNVPGSFMDNHWATAFGPGHPGMMPHGPGQFGPGGYGQFGPGGYGQFGPGGYGQFGPGGYGPMGPGQYGPIARPSDFGFYGDQFALHQHGAYGPGFGAGLEFDDMIAAQNEARDLSAGGRPPAEADTSAGQAAHMLRFGRMGAEWYGRRVFSGHPELYNRLLSQGTHNAQAAMGRFGNTRAGRWVASSAGRSMAGQAGLHVRGLGVVTHGSNATALALQSASHAGQASRFAGIASRGLARAVPLLNVGVAALDSHQFYQDMKDPNTSTGRRIASGVTAGVSCVAATNIPVVSQVAGVISFGTSLLRDFL
jgi:hypothetical protein